MALIDCRECEKEFSDTRPDCPHCGAYQHGQAPVESSTIINTADPELMQLVEERKHKTSMLERLQNIDYSKSLDTFKNGMKKTKRSLLFSYVHGEVVSFNSYMDTDVDVQRTSVREVTGINSRTTYDAHNAYTDTTVNTTARNVVSNVNVTKTKVTEIALKHATNGAINKFYFRGPEIEFLRAGDPITIGYFDINWNMHTDNPEDFESFGLIHGDAICPVMVIGRGFDAHHAANFVTDSSIFVNEIFDDKLGRWNLTIVGAVTLDVVLGTFPLFLLVDLALLVFMKFSMKKGQKKRREEFARWWYKQADDAIALSV